MTNSSKPQDNLIFNDASESIRSLPINYDIKDELLFVHELFKKIPGSHAKIKRSVNIVNNSIFDIFGFGPLAKYSKSSVAGRKAKIFQYLKYFKVIKPAHIIPKGSWVTDDWSSGYFHWFADALTRAELIRDYTNK